MKLICKPNESATNNFEKKKIRKEENWLVLFFRLTNASK